MLENITMVKEAYMQDINADEVDVLHIVFVTGSAPNERQKITVNYADLSAGEKTTIDDLKTMINSRLNQTH